MFSFEEEPNAILKAAVYSFGNHRSLYIYIYISQKTQSPSFMFLNPEVAHMLSDWIQLSYLKSHSWAPVAVIRRHTGTCHGNGDYIFQIQTKILHIANMSTHWECRTQHFWFCYSIYLIKTNSFRVFSKYQYNVNMMWKFYLFSWIFLSTLIIISNQRTNGDKFLTIKKASALL